MPAVVDAFRADKDYIEVRKIQSDILRQYEGDFGKHIVINFKRIILKKRTKAKQTILNKRTPCDITYFNSIGGNENTGISYGL